MTNDIGNYGTKESPRDSFRFRTTSTFHKRADTRAMIEAAGHAFEYLPPYSPDLNPIKQKWAQAKAVRRRTGRTTEQIFAIQNWNQI